MHSDVRQFFLRLRLYIEASLADPVRMEVDEHNHQGKDIIEKGKEVHVKKFTFYLNGMQLFHDLKHERDLESFLSKLRDFFKALKHDKTTMAVLTGMKDVI